MSEQFTTEHIDKTIEKLNERPEQSIADDLKAYFTKMLQNADFVQVVRCKDCSHYIEPYCARFITAMIPVNENDFCSKGKRKESK